MDKKQKKKRILAVCFVLVCGVVFLGIHYGGQRKEPIVLEKVSQETESTVKAEGEGNVEHAGVTLRPEEEPEENVLLCVHICGAVVTEGVYSLPDGSRVADGIAAAGGFTEQADTTYHNLAARLADGQKVYVPTVEETRKLPVTERTEPAGEWTGEDHSPDTATGKVNLNTADIAELMTLSGIGEAKAKSILQYREKVGLFQSIEELKKVSGIGEAMFERVREEIVVE